MKHFYTNALLLLAMSCSALTANAVITRTVDTYIPEERKNWKISGCSQCDVNAGKSSDGDLSRIIDDDINTFWHTNWQAPNQDQLTYGHYFIIDRGENAPKIDRFGYTPRQNNGGNGFVTKYRLFAVDEKPELPVCDGSWSTADNDPNHTQAVEWSKDRIPLASGEFDIVYNDVSTHGEHLVDLDFASAARYLVFFMDGASSDNSNSCFANCADFKTYIRTTVSYDVLEATDLLGKKVLFKNCQHNFYMGVGTFNGLKSNTNTGTYNCLHNEKEGPSAIWTLVPTSEEGKYKVYNEYYKCYIGVLPDTNDTRTQVVDEEENANEWIVRLEGDNFVFQTANGTESGISCLHMVNWDGIVRWYANSEASQFVATIVDDDMFNRWAKEKIAAIEEACCGAIGYSVASDESNAAIEALSTNPNDYDSYRKAEAVLAASELNLVLPIMGRYYTITYAGGNNEGRMITETYLPNNEEKEPNVRNQIKALFPDNNIVPAMWMINGAAEPDEDLYTFTAANSGKFMSRVAWSVPMTTVNADDEGVGHYDILNHNHRGYKGVSLVNYINQARSDYAVAQIRSDLRIDSYKSDILAWWLTEVNAVTITFTNDYVAVNYPFAVTVPNGVIVYTIDAVSADGVILKPVEVETIAPNTPVVLYSKLETADLVIDYADAEHTVANSEDTVLKGTNEPLTLEGAFVLENGRFVAAEKGEIPANTAYIVPVDAEGSLEINVPVISIALSETELTLTPGETCQLAAIVEPENATGENTVTWSTSNAAVVTISEAGMVTAVAVGTADITATCGKVTATCTVIVSNSSVSSIKEILTDETGVILHDLSGRRVLNPSSGVYLMTRNGRTTLIVL